MSRDILTNKWVLGGVSFLIVLSVACVLWYQHDTADERKAAAEAEELLRQSEAAKKVSDTDGETEQAADVAPAESETPTAEKPVNKNTAEVGNNTEAETQQQSETPSETETVSEARVSPYGFGPYPKIPPGYRAPNIFDKPLSRDQELMMRVDVKLWQQGIHTEGIRISGKTGLVYPSVQGTIYVTWSDFHLPDGSVEKVAQSLSGHGDTVDSLPRGLSEYSEIFVPKHIVFKKNIPSHITVLEHSEGIDPYQFLKEELK